MQVAATHLQQQHSCNSLPRSLRCMRLCMQVDTAFCTSRTVDGSGYVAAMLQVLQLHKSRNLHYKPGPFVRRDLYRAAEKGGIT